MLTVMVDVLMLFYTQAQLEYSANFCETFLARAEPSLETSRETQLREVVVSEKLKPEGLLVQLDGASGKGELSFSYKPLTPFSEHVIRAPLHLTSRFIVN